MFGETFHRYPVLDLQAEHPSLWAQVSHGEVCPSTLSLAVIIACHFLGGTTVVSLPFLRRYHGSTAAIFCQDDGLTFNGTRVLNRHTLGPIRPGSQPMIEGGL